MADTLDSVPGNWTLWVRTTPNTPADTYQAVVTAPDQVTVTSVTTGETYTGTWQEKQGILVPDAETVTFTIQSLKGSGNSVLTGYMVGLAMGGGMKNPLGAWSAYKTSD